MGEITSDGYQSLRDFLNSSVAVPNQWDYIALFDDTGSEVLRVSITGDTRAQWQDVDGDPILQAKITITGGDSDVPTPTTFNASAVFDDTAANSGVQITQQESFTQATLDQSGDELTVTHDIEVPNQ